MNKKSNKNINSKGSGNRTSYRKSNSKDKDCKSKKTMTYDEAQQEVNNPEWRMFSDLLANQVMSFPFTSIAGGTGTLDCIPKGELFGNFNPAGIMRFDVNPSIGFSDSDTSAANQAARYLYTKLSANNMKTTQYGPQDVLMALLSLGEVVSISAYCRRALGVLGTVNPRNWYYPKSVIEAMGIKYDDFVKNAAIYRTRYNYIVAIASAIAFPADIKYFDSCRALFNDVFLDHTTGLAQTYMFVPATYWSLNEKAEGGSALETKPFVAAPTDVNIPNPTENFSFYLDKLEEVINNLMTSATLQYLYADVLKYVGNNGGALLTIENVPDNYSVLPVYSEEVLSWVENSVIMGTPETGVHGASTPSNNVITDAGSNAIKYSPTFARGGLAPDAPAPQVMAEKKDITILLDPLLNFHVDNPSVKDRIIATRFVPGNIQVVEANITTLYVTATLPDHYIVTASVMGTRSDGNHEFVVTHRLTPGLQYSDYSTALFLFHRRPRFILGAMMPKDKGQGAFTINVKDLACELDNYTVVSNDVMGTIQDVANLALLRF